MRYIDHPDQDLDPRAFAGDGRVYGKSSPPPPPDYRAAAQETAAGNLEAARLATRANRVDQFTPWGSSTFTDLGNDRWRQDTTLTPQAQQTLDRQLRLSDQYADVAQIGFDRTRSLLENPQLDLSQLPERAIDVGQTAQQAIMSRLQPQLAQQEEALRTRLANQGITLGSQAYNTEMQQQAQRANDLQMQAALQGISLDQANRGAALQEQAFLQDRPLNLINALRTGAQVQAPQFQQFAQQATTQGPNMLGAAQANYGAQMDAFNAQQAQQSGLMSGLFGVGMGLAGLPVAGGGSFGGNLIGGLFR